MTRTTTAPTAWRVVWWFGFVSLAADMVYEGARSVYGPVLAALGASALVVGLVTGAGEAIALVLRLALLASISWIVGLTYPLFTVFGIEISWRSLILIGGGLFLVYKGTHEIHESVEGAEHGTEDVVVRATFSGVIVQILLLDIVFSLDSVITAVGMANQLPVMIAAVVIAMAVMLAASGPVAGFVNRHPTVKMLALSFLLLIGMTLVADGFGAHVPKGYIYAAIGFSILVEMLNQLAGRRRRRSLRPGPAGGTTAP